MQRCIGILHIQRQFIYTYTKWGDIWIYLTRLKASYKTQFDLFDGSWSRPRLATSYTKGITMYARCIRNPTYSTRQFTYTYKFAILQTTALQ